MRLGGVRRLLVGPRRRLEAARARREWQAQALAFYGSFVRPGELCFDIGANIGNRVRVFLALGARVVAVEPQRACADELRKRGGAGGALTVIEAAAGAEAGEAQLFVADYHTVSSLSRDWIDRVRAAGRFDLGWRQAVTVPVTTLDALIAEYGAPTFCKIDVEGYEEQVLAGLSQPLRALSFEFTPEYEEAAFACVRRLAALGMTRFAYSAGESLRLGEWTTADRIVEQLREQPHDGRAFGDVYAAM